MKCITGNRKDSESIQHYIVILRTVVTIWKIKQQTNKPTDPSGYAL